VCTDYVANQSMILVFNFPALTPDFCQIAQPTDNDCLQFFSWFRSTLIQKYLCFSGSTEPPVVFLDSVIFFPWIKIFVSLFLTPPVELFGGVLLPSNIWINCNYPSNEVRVFLNYISSKLFVVVTATEAWVPKFPPSITVTTMPSCNCCYAYFSSEKGLNTHISAIAACREHAMLTPGRLLHQPPQDLNAAFYNRIPSLIAFRQKNGDVPTLTDILHMRSNVNLTYTYFANNILPKIVGPTKWRGQVTKRTISRIATPTDEAFGLLLLENSWENWKEARRLVHEDNSKSGANKTPFIYSLW